VGQPRLAADTAVLLAALPGKAQPVFARRRTTGFDVPVRRFVANSLIGVLPVRTVSRDSLCPVARCRRPRLRAGRTVVIYPEGTRSTDGSMGEFRPGPFGWPVTGCPDRSVAVLAPPRCLPNGRQLHLPGADAGPHR